MLSKWPKWRESMNKKPKKYRYWSCPRCTKWYEWHGDDEEEETTTTAEADSHDVQQLKADNAEMAHEQEVHDVVSDEQQRGQVVSKVQLGQ